MRYWKPTTLLKATVFEFLLVNTRYFWEWLPKGLAFLIYIVLFMLFFVLVLGVFFAAIQAVFKKADLSQTGQSLGTTLVLLALIYVFPTGIIDFAQWESPDLMTACREGTANCTTTIHLKPGKKFIAETRCFGLDRSEGNYRIAGDTIYFDYDQQSADGEKFAYGVLHRNARDQTLQLRYFQNMTFPRSLDFLVLKNSLLE